MSCPKLTDVLTQLYIKLYLASSNLHNSTISERYTVYRISVCDICRLQTKDRKQQTADCRLQIVN